jgi:hypothetical protein
MSKSILTGFSASAQSSRLSSSSIIFPVLVISGFISIWGVSKLLSSSGLAGTPQTTCMFSSTSFFGVSTVKGHLNVSSGACLGNAFSPPYFNADHVADCYADGFSSVGVESFVYELV